MYQFAAVPHRCGHVQNQSWPQAQGPSLWASASSKSSSVAMCPTLSQELGGRNEDRGGDRGTRLAERPQAGRWVAERGGAGYAWMGQPGRPCSQRWLMTGGRGLQGRLVV